jgi:glycosyltransferase involved in cell wall biosynthesis
MVYKVNNSRKLKFLYLSSDKYPPFRVDVAVLFGKEFTKRGHHIHWILQSEGACKKGYSTFWNGSKVYVSPTDKRKNIIYRIKKYLLQTLYHFKMFGLIKKNNYDFIQVKDLFLAAVLAAMISKIKKIKFFYWLSFPIPEAYIYQYRESKYFRIFQISGLWFRFLLYKIILPTADHVFAQSEQMKLDLISKGVAEKKITPVPMGIETDNQEFNDKASEILYLGPDKKLLYLGTMAKSRKLDFIFRVLKEVLKEGLPCKLYMVGDSKNYREFNWLKSKAEEIGLKNEVVFTGNLPRKKAFEYVNAADVCLSPFVPIAILNSTSPTKLIEYLYMGKATVANDHPEQCRVLEESQGGICVPYDEKAFAKAIITLLKDAKLARKMGQNGRKYVIKNRSYHIIADNLESKYQEILKKIIPFQPSGKKNGLKK